MASDEETELMSELLTRGATMLGEHCDECGNPLFRLRGNKICAVCDQDEAVRRKEEVEKNIDAIDDSFEGGDGGDDASIREDVRRDLTDLARQLSREAREENDLSRINETLEALERTVDLLERV